MMSDLRRQCPLMLVTDRSVHAENMSKYQTTTTTNLYRERNINS